MRCRRALEWMTVADALAPRRRRALERHLAVCGGCRAEQAVGVRLDAAFAMLVAEAPVSAKLEQDTLRAVRLAAAAEDDLPASTVTRSVAWWLNAAVPALATAAVLMVAVGVYHSSRPEKPRTPAGPERVASPAAPATRAVADARPVGTHAKPAAPTAVATRAPSHDLDLAEPPPELAAAPERFIDLPVVRNLDKLEHYEAITAVDDDGPSGTEPQTDG